MRRLTNLQIEHLIDRINTVLGNLTQIEIDKLGPEPRVPTYLDSEKLDLIRRGKAKLKDGANNESRSYVSLCSYFNFPQTAAMVKATNQRERWQERAKKIREMYAAEKTRLRDEAILGDSTEALQMLQAVERRLANANTVI